MNEEIENLEIKVSYLEASLDELNSVVVNQQKEIDALNLSVEKLTQKLQNLIEEAGTKLQNLIEEAGTPDRPSRRPPHY